MAESVGPRSGGDGSGKAGGDAWPSMPEAPPTAPSMRDAPTDPEPDRTGDGLPAPAGGPAPPVFHDLSGYAPPGSDPTAPAGQPFAPAYPQPGYPPPYGYPPYPGSAHGPYAYGAWSPPKTNGLAIASMVCGICSFALCQVFAIPGLILGLRARRQIRESGGAETGDPFALAGVILSGIGLFLLVAIVALYAVIIGVSVAGA